METTHHDLIVIGGGPAGSTAAAIAARAGLRVLLLEAAAHPRFHIGESLLPGIIPILEEMGALANVESAGFTRKTGSTHWGWGVTPEWDLWFTDSEAYDHAWLVDRARFDEILFRAATRAGAETYEHAAAKSLVREGDRVVGVRWRARGETGLREARASVTLDASGQAAMVARDQGLRSLIEGLQHEASFAHFSGADRLPEPRSNQALFIATEGQWMWHFPLSETVTSVGVIRLRDTGATDEAREKAFDESISQSERLMAVLGPDARRVTSVRSLHDWSYRVSRVCEPGLFLAGDASGFIDPVLSTGVFLAMHAGRQSARAAHDIVFGARSEEEALHAYQVQHSELFNDMLRMVRFFYQQKLGLDDYFWESKRILVERAPEIRPQKAFMVLTSGLVRNLAYDEKVSSVRSRRQADVLGGAGPIEEGYDPDKLGFVCFHLRYLTDATPAALYFLIEPIESAAPTLFTTKNWHLNCLAPRFKNDPILVPDLAPHLRALEREISKLDTVPGESLSVFWRRTRVQLMRFIGALPLELVRVFGE